MISFKNLNEGGYNVITENGGNAQPWHIPLLEEFIADLKREFEEPPEEDDFDDLC